MKKGKKRDRSEEERDDDLGGFFDTECREDNREDDDEPVEDPLTDLLFFDFECRQENGTHEPNLCIVQNEAGDEWIFQGDTTQFSRLRQLLYSSVLARARRHIRCDYAWRKNSEFRFPC